MRDMANKVNEEELYEENKLNKYISMFLCLSMYVSNLYKILKYVQKQDKPLPDSPSGFILKSLNAQNQETVIEYFNIYAGELKK